MGYFIAIGNWNPSRRLLNFLQKTMEFDYSEVNYFLFNILRKKEGDFPKREDTNASTKKRVNYLS